MKKVLIAYSSRTGTTEKMANYLAEGVRMSGQEAQVEKISALKKRGGHEGCYSKY